jgi:hypothetical protein
LKTDLTLLAIIIFLGTQQPPAALALSQAEMVSVRQMITKGNALMMRKQFRSAIDEYEAALEIDPTNDIAKLNIAETHNNWGIQYYSQKNFKEAITEWQRCLKANPNHLKAKRNIDIALQAAADQGVDLYSDEGHRDGLDDERVVASPPSKKEPGKDAAEGTGDSFSIGVSESVGAGDTGAKTPGKMQVPTESPPSDSGVHGAAMIMRNGFNLSASSPPAATESSSAPVPEPVPAAVAPPAGNPTQAFVAPQAITPAQPAVPAQQPIHFSNPTYPSAPAQFSNQAPPPAVTPTQLPAAPAAVSPALAAPSSGVAGSLEEKLTAVEVQLTGKKQTDMTILQRIEKMEEQSCGQIRNGYTIMDRVEYLRRTVGL